MERPFLFARAIRCCTSALRLAFGRLPFGLRKRGFASGLRPIAAALPIRLVASVLCRHTNPRCGLDTW